MSDYMESNKNKPIAIFDSGVGGLTVLRRAMKVLPDEAFIYFGDTARAPYGIHTKERILSQSREIMRFLSQFDFKLVMIACNTISALCYTQLSAEFKVPMLEIITPAADYCAESVVKATGNLGKIGVIATEATVRSGVFTHEVTKRVPMASVTELPCPELVVLAEAGLCETSAAAAECEKSLAPLKALNISHLVLGCTHFPLFKKHIDDVLGSQMQIIDPARAAAQRIYSILKESNSLAEAGDTGKGHRFYITGDTKRFDSIAGIVLGEKISAESVTLS